VPSLPVAAPALPVALPVVPVAQPRSLGVPALPGLPSLPGVPALPGVPSLPAGVPSVSGMHVNPTGDALDAAKGEERSFQAPALSQLDTTSLLGALKLPKI
jgi:hypothetical protein